jgi:hypothetical protein
MQRTPILPKDLPKIPEPKLPKRVQPSALQEQNLPPPENDIPYANQPVPGGPLNVPNEKIYPAAVEVGPLLHTDKVKKRVMYVENLEESPNASLDANKKDTNVGIPGLYLGPLGKVVEEANLFYLAGFALIYLVASIVMGGATNVSRILDVLLVLSVVVFIIYSYVKYPVSFKADNWSADLFKPFVETANDKYNNLTLWQSALLFLVFAYVIIYVIGIPMGDGKPITISIIENMTWLFIVSQLIYLMMKYWFNVDLFELLRKKTEEEDANKEDTDAPKKVDTNEVFNIADNKYTYKEAAAVCSSFDARLASYSEVEDAYKSGGEWCNYGWSEDQMIYYPTQMQTWTDLQKNPATKHSCGRPGVNGGFMANPHLKFGVNCYGKRPAKKDSDIQPGMLTVPKLPEDIELEKQVKEWQANKDKMLRIHSFNRTTWSQQ